MATAAVAAPAAAMMSPPAGPFRRVGAILAAGVLLAVLVLAVLLA